MGGGLGAQPSAADKVPFWNSAHTPIIPYYILWPSDAINAGETVNAFPSDIYKAL